jgi:hypothetical protein
MLRAPPSTASLRSLAVHGFTGCRPHFLLPRRARRGRASDVNPLAPLRVLLLVAAILPGCGDDAARAAAGDAASGSGGAGGDPSASSSGGAPSTTASAAATTTATTTATSTATATGGGGEDGGGGAAPDACAEVVVGDGQCDACGVVPGRALPLEDQTTCTADSGEAWPAKIWGVDVTAGDCLYMRADNEGSPEGADLFGAIVDPGGKSLLFDEEAPCTVENPEGYLCPAGGIVVETTGRAYVVVGSWEGEGCPPETTTPIQLTVGRNGVDVDLSDAFVCAGDLLEIIP